MYLTFHMKFDRISKFSEKIILPENFILSSFKTVVVYYFPLLYFENIFSLPFFFFLPNLSRNLACNFLLFVIIGFCIFQSNVYVHLIDKYYFI